MFCPSCGQIIQDASGICPSCSINVGGICEGCGEEVTEFFYPKYQLCIKCGTFFYSDDEDEPENPECQKCHYYGCRDRSRVGPCPYFTDRLDEPAIVHLGGAQGGFTIC